MNVEKLIEDAEKSWMSMSQVFRNASSKLDCVEFGVRHAIAAMFEETEDEIRVEYVAVIGGPSSGFKVYGPFHSVEDAASWAEVRSPLIGWVTVMEMLGRDKSGVNPSGSCGGCPTPGDVGMGGV